jgi:hypothetical protein
MPPHSGPLGLAPGEGAHPDSSPGPTEPGAPDLQDHRAINHGEGWRRAATVGYINSQLNGVGHLFRSDSQADSTRAVLLTPAW